MRTLFIALIAILDSTGAWAADPLPSKPVLTLAYAEEVMDAAMDAVTRLKAPSGTIAIVDDGGHVVLVKRLNNTMPATPPVAIGKARTAAIFKTPTAKFEQIIRDGRTPMLNIDGFTPMQGGVPLVLDGNVIGAIGVSGAASAAQDEEIAVAGAKHVGVSQ